MGPACLAHAADEERDAAFKQLSQDGKIDARGVTISSTLLEKILDSTPRDLHGHPMFTDAQFGLTTFEGNAGFERATFEGKAWFGQATFEGNAGFESATFEDEAWFAGATFRGNAQFAGATFRRDAWLGVATFEGNAGFERATFEGKAWFGQATFRGIAGFELATFRDVTLFSGATFQGDVRFALTTFQDTADFPEAAFERAQQFGPVLAHRGLNLDGVQFAQPVQIEASTTGLCCRRARFSGGVQFRLRWARVVLDDTDLSAPSLVAGIPRLASDEMTLAEQRIARAWKRLLAGKIAEQPRLLSVQRANGARASQHQPD